MLRLLKFCILICTLLTAQPVHAKELALVIGIDQYDELPDLNKAIEDATGYSELFESQGFEVYYLANPTSVALRLELARFYDRIEGGDTVVFIYSGHGWSDGALNYLVPSDTPDLPTANIAAEMTVLLKNGVNGILDRINAQGAGLTVAVIDACRDNPFSKAETRAVGTRGGLAPIEPPSGTFIVYSAASNQTALDRLGEADTMQYSVFTRFFLPNLREMGDLREAAVETRSQVLEAASIVGHQQRLAYYDELTGTSCLFGDCSAPAPEDVVETAAVSAPVANPPDSQAAITWSFLQFSSDPLVLGTFVERFKETDPEYAELARLALRNLANEGPSAEPAPERVTVVEPPAEEAPDISVAPDMGTNAGIAYAEAQRRIANAAGKSLDLGLIVYLETIPSEIGNLSDLQVLSLKNTRIEDLSPLAGLSQLQQLNLNYTSVSDFTALSGLYNLNVVSSVGTPAEAAGLYFRPSHPADVTSSVAPITTVPSSSAELAYSEAQNRIANSNGSRLDLSGLTNLQRIPAEIMSLPNLSYLDISNTSVRDLSVLDEMYYLNEPIIDGTPLEEARAQSDENIDLAYRYLTGDNLEQNFGLALSLYHKAHKQYDWFGLAAHQLGHMYDEGKGTLENDVTAVEYLIIGVERGRGDSAQYLSLMYEYGEGVPQSYVDAAELVILSLELGSDWSITRPPHEYTYEMSIQIQTALRDLGFYNGRIDGRIGTQTHSAMRAYCQC